jgi:carboxyl-terminal processing protease
MRSTLAGVPSRLRSLRLVAVALLAVGAGCGKGGSGGGATPLGPSSASAARCVAPRIGIDPQTGAVYLDRSGTLADEKAWVRAWIDELYLWYREVPNPDPAPYPTAVAYFNVLKTSARTPSGALKDKFHFTYPTDVWVALSQSGIEAGYGVQWVLLSRYVPRQALVAWVEPGSPGALAGLVRGTELLTVDGVDLATDNTATGVDTLNAGMWPATVGESHVFGIRDQSGVTRTVTLTSAAVTGTPVPVVKTLAGGAVGYMLFNDHIATAEAQLIPGVLELLDAGVTDLVLDLRLNGGGYLAIASQLAYMIAGPAATAGKTFERLVFNDKAGARDPVTGELNAPFGFIGTGLGWTTTPSSFTLPSLGLARVYVLTGAGTCSASESIINSLRGIGVQVIQVGQTTCGKPFGFYPQDNCGTTYFAIQFQGVNAAGFGDYGDGFVPAGTGTNGVPGCVVLDDYLHALGDPAEGRLAVALGHRATGTCTPATGMALRAQRAATAEGELVKSPLRQNRILARP